MRKSTPYPRHLLILLLLVALLSWSAAGCAEAVSGSAQETEKPDPEDTEKPDLEDPEKPDPEDPEKPDPEDPEKPDPEDPEKPDPEDPEKPDPEDPEDPDPEDPEILVPAGPPITDAQMKAIVEDRNHIYFDYHAAIASHADFFLFPFPSDMRVDTQGCPSYGKMKFPLEDILVIGPLVKKIRKINETERRGFSPQGAIYMRSSIPLKLSGFPSPERSIDPNSCLQLVNVETDSTHYGERVPVYVNFKANADKVWDANTLVVRPVPGLGMHPGDTYALFILNNCLKSETGTGVYTSRKLEKVLNLTAPPAYDAVFTPALQELHKMGVNIERISALTVFRTSNPAKEMLSLAKNVQGKGYVVKDNDGKAKGKYTCYSWGCRFDGQFVTYNFIEGVYPYSGDNTGIIRFDLDGNVTSKPKAETVNYAISVPRTHDVPADGFPLIVYGHGTGGSSKTHCEGYSNDEGIVLLNKGVPAAMIGLDACLQGARGENPSDFELYSMFLKNPEVVRESVRQTVIDMMVIYELIEAGEFVLPPRPTKSGQDVTFNNKHGMYMGHSQGSQEAGLLLGIEPRIKNAFLSAGGGGLSLSMTQRKFDIEFGGLDYTGYNVADILGELLQVQRGEISVDSFIVTQIAQPLLDPIDPLNFAHLFIKEPIPGAEPKNIAQTIGLNDESTPDDTQFALSVAMGVPTVGRIFKTTTAMEIVDFDATQAPPVHENVDTPAGKVTAGAMQFVMPSSSTTNPHFVIYYIDSARNTYPYFFQSVLDGKPEIFVVGQ